MVLEAIKGLYYSLEEKWYAFWDKVDTKIPVHGALDAIDSVIPSLVLFLIIIFLLIVLGIYFGLSSFQSFDAAFKIITSDGKAVNDTIIKANLMQNGKLVKELSERTDAGGMIVFKNLSLGQEIVFDINISKGTSNDSFTIDGPINETIRLSAPPIILKPVTKRITVKDALGLNPTEDIQLAFSCANSSSLPEPQTAVYDGTKPVEVTEPINCILQATVKNPKYKQKTYIIDSLLKTINLEKYEEPTVPFKIKIRSNDYPVNDTSFKIKLSGKKEYEAATGSSSEAILQVIPDTYSIIVSDSRGNYGLASRTQTVDRETEITIAVTKSVKARVTIKTIDSATGAIIIDATVMAKDSSGREMETRSTGTTGTAVFAFTDAGTYSFSAKKIGDLTTGYFQKEITQTLTGDANITIGLEKVTRLNAGRVKVKVTDQDDEPVINARVMLKHVENQGIVDLFQEKNYALTDINGEANLLAGNVEGQVTAYAIKGPFNGTSIQKTIQIAQLNTFNVQLQIGLATIKINAIGEGGEGIDGTAEIQTIDGRTADAHGVAGLISLEKGKAQRQVKAGQTIYVKTKSETYEDYYTAPIMLWPDKTYTFNITMLKTISEPAITRAKVYNENDSPVQTMAAGKKYYAKILINSDKQYSQVLLHFRAGKETLMENDIMQIDQVEASGINSETRGVTYAPTKGYSFDGANLTDGQAKWTNVLWNNFGQGTREIKVWFRIKNTAPPNAELKFYYRAQFDSTRVPPSTAQQDFYADSYESDTYYVGTEAECTEGFCFNSEWLYSANDQLYMDAPFQLKQVNNYRYHFSLLNNSGIDYGKTDKQVYLNLKVAGDEQGEKRINIKGYDIKDPVGRLSKTTPNNTLLFGIENAELTSFQKDTSIDVSMDLEGLKDGAETILAELRSEGKIIYSKELTFSIVKEKDMGVKISPQFIPALINTQVQVDVVDEHGDYLSGVTVTTFAKEPGIDRYQVDSAQTDRMGRAIVNSGALFQSTKLILELTKEGYARQTYSIQVSNQVVTFAPEQLLVELNTYSQREEIKQVSFANLTQEDLIIQSITTDAHFQDVINEDALQGYFSEISEENRTLKAINLDDATPDALDIDLLRIRIADSITQSTLTEPISAEGTIKVIFKEKNSPLTFDIYVPLKVNVSSEANPGDSCLILKPYKTKATTEKAQVSFDFEIQNACTTGRVNLPLDNLTVSSSAEIPGIAEVSIRSASGTSTGRTALDGGNRTLLNKVKAGEKLFGTITFAPSEDAIGKSIPLQVSFEAKFNGTTIKSNPTTLTLTANVINLKECMSISSEAGPVAFKEKAKITIDASACLGQKIDVMLCKNDPGCSGGADGKISLSKRSFTIQNASQDIEAYGPTYPGTYGVTVVARARGTTGFTEIGEIPVSFSEPDGKFFSMNKFELNLIGAGAQDAVLLTNKMLTQNVNVKANGCVWGQQRPKMNWMNVIAGASMGAALGQMIGSGFSRTTAKDRARQQGTSGTGQGTQTTSGDADTAQAQARDARITQLENAGPLTPQQTSELNGLYSERSLQQQYSTAISSAITTGTTNRTLAITTADGQAVTRLDSGQYVVHTGPNPNDTRPLSSSDTLLLNGQSSQTTNVGGGGWNRREVTFTVQNNDAAQPRITVTATGGYNMSYPAGGPSSAYTSAAASVGNHFATTSNSTIRLYNLASFAGTYSGVRAASHGISSAYRWATTSSVRPPAQTTPASGAAATTPPASSAPPAATPSAERVQAVPVDSTTGTSSWHTDASGNLTQNPYADSSAQSTDFPAGGSIPLTGGAIASGERWMRVVGSGISTQTWEEQNQAPYTEIQNKNGKISFLQLSDSIGLIDSLIEESVGLSNSLIDASLPIVLPKLSTISFSGIENIVESKKSKISFAGNTPAGAQMNNGNTSTGTYAGYGALIGAVAGALVAYYMDPSKTFDCHDSQYDQIVGYTDYSILLEGQDITVASTSGGTSEKRTVPSDAIGDPVFSLDGISPEWDFTDASVSSDETVGIKFTNNGLNDPKPRYGTLTINAAKHDHGKRATLSGTSTTSTSTTTSNYDVTCTKPTFGNYWIGKEDEDGKCATITDSTYSQKYHLRILSGEPSGEEAYIKKATTCYMGALTGSTGTDAVPRIKLDWAWDSINANTCDYTNPEYVYCDATQFTIALVKKLANLDEFFARNGNNFACPPDAVQDEVLSAMNQINSDRVTVPQGVVGISNVEMNIDTQNDQTSAIITIQNNTGAAITTYMSYGWRSASGGNPTAPAPEQWSVPAGESTKTIGPVGTPKHSDPYYFTAVMNGPKGNRRAVTRVFLNRPIENSCWINTTTRQVAGMPGIMYYVANMDNSRYLESGITDETDLYNAINFGVFLTKDAFTQDFFKDFKQYYLNQVFTDASRNTRQRAILQALDSGRFAIKKKFMGTNEVEPGLYDVWINIDSQNGFRVLDGNNSTVEITLLLVKKPSVDSPFYSIPFDGMLGERGGRQGYGTVYNVEARGNSTRFEISKTSGETTTTFPNAGSNGVTKLTVNTKTTFDALNTSAGTRGQLASASISNNEASLAFTPNYATPVIAKYSLQGTSGNFAYSIENNRTGLATGGNLGYWTGAARSRDFYGANAVETYNNSPDYKLTKLGENVYGYEYNEASRAGTMYLKTTFFTPADSSEYILTAKDPNALFWTPNSDFLSTTILNGINGMQYNSKLGGRSGTLNSLQDLFDGVKAGKICVSSDGADSSFWWNPAVIETTVGSTNSLANKELELVGAQ